MTRKTAKYKVGQVVSLATLKFYQSTERKGEQFQKIVRVWPWTGRGFECRGFGLTFQNGDQCHEKMVKPLTTKEKQ